MKRENATLKIVNDNLVISLERFEKEKREDETTCMLRGWGMGDRGWEMGTRMGMGDESSGIGMRDGGWGMGDWGWGMRVGDGRWGWG